MLETSGLLFFDLAEDFQLLFDLEEELLLDFFDFFFFDFFFEDLDDLEDLLEDRFFFLSLFLLEASDFGDFWIFPSVSILGLSEGRCSSDLIGVSFISSCFGGSTCSSYLTRVSYISLGTSSTSFYLD